VSSEDQPEWYFDIQGEQVGPLTTAKVYELIDSSRLSEHDQVWDPAAQGWKPAGQFFDFAPAAPPPAKAMRPSRQNAASPDAGPQAREKPWYRESGAIIGILSLLVTVVIGLLSVPFLADYWQQNLVGGPLDGYRRADASAFLSVYEGEWCAEGPLVFESLNPRRMRVTRKGPDTIHFEFGNVVEPMAIPGRTTAAEPQFVKSNEGTVKRLLMDGKSTYFVEFDGEIFAGIVTYERLQMDGGKNLWRRYYIKDNKSEMMFQAELKRCK
jgi:hypothetical protein